MTVPHWKMKFQAEAHCRMCLRSDRVRPLTKHHLVPQRWFMREGVRWRMWRNRTANLVPLCDPCHRLVEHDVDARRELRRCLSQTEIAFAIVLRGQAWFDSLYPPSRVPRSEGPSAAPGPFYRTTMERCSA